MHITVFCPHCQSRYQLDPALRGKRICCLNTICRMVFEVREERAALPPRDLGTERTPAPARSSAHAGSVGEIVPVLSAEPAAPEPLVGPQPFQDLEIPGDDEGSSSAFPAPNNDGPLETHLLEMQPGAWEAPPVRGIAQIVAGAEAASLPARAEDTGTMRQGTRKRRRLALICTMPLILGLALAGGFYLVSARGETSEAEVFHKAQELYQKQDFEQARELLQKLLRAFPSSKNRRQYEFLVEWSAVREAVYAPRDDAEAGGRALENLLQFLDLYKNEPLLKEYHGDVWRTLLRLARDLAALAEHKDDAAFLKRARRSWAEAAKFTPPADAKADAVGMALGAEFTRVENLLAARTARRELLDTLGVLAARGSAEAVREGRALAMGAGVEHDAAVAVLLQDLVKAHRERVVFKPAALGAGGLTPGRPARDLARDQLPSYYIAPLVGKAPATVAPGRAPHVVLALAHGVVYALDAVRGDILWVRRVGVDTTVLPVRVPASLFGPELVLLLSSDCKSICAVAADTGALVWEQALCGVCLGQPVLVDGHLLVPTLSGEVEDIDTAGGTLQGSYSLGQALVVGGVRQPGTALVYFPADSYCVYVLDVARRVCAGVLYSGHASGSLRGLPLVWNETREGSVGRPVGNSATPQVSDTSQREGWLLLHLASGYGNVELRPYALPIRQPDQKAADPRIQVRGDAHAAPWQNGEKLALATDAGLLAVYGIRQRGNRDSLLFPLLKEDYRLGSAPSLSRALVVHADAENYWVISGGKLQRLQSAFTAQAGPGLVARWPQPLEVGSPLHEAQLHVGDGGRLALILVTQELASPACWILAVDADDGYVLWQRQLGMAGADQPVTSGAAVLCADARGSVLFQAAPALKDWQPAGAHFEALGSQTKRWVCARGAGFVELSWGADPSLRVRLVDSSGGATVKTHALPAVPLGTPALGSDFVLVPLANGVVLRVSLGEGGATYGPEWRGVGVDEAQPGHIVALGNDDFAISDGGRSLVRYHSSEARSWDKRGEAKMAQRITAAPAVLDGRLVVADASATVTLLEGDRPIRAWSMDDKISAGPFVRAQGIGLVLDKKRLVWLEPAKDQPAWEYSFTAPIVGEPELVDGLLVVADLQGGIMGLDPATGNPAGPGYRLKANEAPTGAPVAFGTGQIFVPLMDGTALVLPVASLRQQP